MYPHWSILVEVNELTLLKFYMSSIFNKIRSSLGLEAKSESKGHILGSRVSPPEEAERTKVFEVCFQEEKMGMQVEAAEGGLPLITKVFEDSSAYQHGVKPGDLIIAIDDLEITSYDHCMDILKGSARPINLRYLGMCFHSMLF